MMVEVIIVNTSGNQYSFLFIDPRPELVQDSNLWTKLLKLIPTLEDRVKAELLQKTLWTMRSCGLMLKLTREGLKFEPIVGEKCAWEYEIDFENDKIKFLKPYTVEISWLLRKVLEP